MEDKIGIFISIYALTVEFFGIAILLTYQSYKFAKKDNAYYKDLLEKTEKELRTKENELWELKCNRWKEK